MNLKTKPTKAAILDYLRSLKNELADNGIEKLGLFGSYAKDCADVASDIDIVIHTTATFTSRHRGFLGVIYIDSLREKIAQHFGICVDICDTHSMPLSRKDLLLKGAIYV